MTPSLTIANRDEITCRIIRKASLSAFAASREPTHFFLTQRRKDAKEGVAGHCPKILPHQGRGTTRRVVEGRRAQLAAFGAGRLSADCVVGPSVGFAATSPVGGGFYAFVRSMLNEDHYPFQILEHIDRRDAQCENAVLRQIRIAPVIARWIIPAIMRFAINLHAQRRLVTVKVEIIGACRMLFAPFMSGLRFTKLLPQKHLGQRHFTAKLLCAFVRFGHAFEHFAASLLALPQQAGGRFRRMQ